MFDIEALTNASIDGPMSTERAVCPEGEFTMMVDTLGENGVKGWFREKPFTREDGTEVPILGIPCVVLDETVKTLLKRDKVLVPAEIFLDVDAGRISTKKGDNVLIGQLRAALNQNDSSGWTLSMLAGQGPFKGIVKHQVGKTGTFAKVTRVAKVA